MNQTYLLYGISSLTIILTVCLLWLAVKLNRLDKIRREFFASELKKDLEQVLIDQNRSVNTTIKDLRQLQQELIALTILNQKNIQRVGFLRFNPFDDAGGNMSFCLALLNAHNDGVVISSLHGREGTRIYSKEIKSGMSESKLTNEELQTIKDAK